MDNKGITLMGLGPGEANLLTRQAWEVLQNASEIYLRTRQHPAVAGFPDSLRIFSFDEIYESNQAFEEVYAQIVEQVLSLGCRPQGVIYAVPGHPFIAEATPPEIARRAHLEGLPLRLRAERLLVRGHAHVPDHLLRVRIALPASSSRHRNLLCRFELRGATLPRQVGVSRTPGD